CHSCVSASAVFAPLNLAAKSKTAISAGSFDSTATASSVRPKGTFNCCHSFDDNVPRNCGSPRSKSITSTNLSQPAKSAAGEAATPTGSALKSNNVKLAACTSSQRNSSASNLNLLMIVAVVASRMKAGNCGGNSV